MPSATAGTLIVRIIGDTREWGRSARAFQSQLLSLQRVASAAFAVFAADSVRAALAVDRTLTRIAALTNTSAAQLGRWRETVSRLASETGRSTQELGEALYFLSSAGLSASQVNEALEVTAKAAAVGLGQSADVARIVSQALNAYSDSGLTATQVTDTLVAAVREGTAEPEEFAAALGRVLPIASRAGVSFDELTASLATLSNIGLDVNEGVTAMRGLLQALVAPGTQAAETMASVGISADEMRRVISEQGILGALRLLEERTGGNLDVMRRIVPNVRALTGALGISGQEAEKVARTFEAVRDSAGSLDRAMRITAQSASFRVSRAFQSIREQGMEVAARVLPPLARAVELAADHFAELAAAIGTLWVLGKIRVLLLATTKAVEALAVASGTKAAAAIAGKLVPALTALRTALGATATQAAILAAAIDLSQDLPRALDTFDAIRSGALDAEEAFRSLSESVHDLTTLFGAPVGAASLFSWLLRDTAAAQKDGARTAEDLARANRDLGRAVAAAGEAAASAGEDIADTGAEAKGTARALRVFARMTTEQFRTWRAGVREDLRDVSDDLGELANDGRVTARELIRALSDQARALADYARNWETVNRRGLPDELARQIAEMGDDGALVLQALANASDRQFSRIVADFRRTQTQAARVASAIGNIGRAIRTLPSSASVAVNIQRGALAGGAGGHGVQLQHGGIVTRPTLALVGEAGPEAVIPLRDRSPLDAERIGRAIAAELLRRERPIVLDRRSFARAQDVAYAYGGAW